ncbi:hypothetical protein [Pelosinus baikalensis]|uniref:Uncharacterized protein n=1 Tax=Pelosinus baikalensis TaxID=2892015 RepID=A0ABS8HZU8_9FIRM|nr:hypothetical protein [Pelosinus baikalensis]MCC5467642.1 hypothetical protein [Pelosinus baikalensis]
MKKVVVFTCMLLIVLSGVCGAASWKEVERHQGKHNETDCEWSVSIDSDSIRRVILNNVEYIKVSVKTTNETEDYYYIELYKFNADSKSYRITNTELHKDGKVSMSDQDYIDNNFHGGLRWKTPKEDDVIIQLILQQIE